MYTIVGLELIEYEKEGTTIRGFKVYSMYKDDNVKGCKVCEDYVSATRQTNLYCMLNNIYEEFEDAIDVEMVFGRNGKLSNITIL